MTLHKNALRKQFLKARRNLTPAQQTDAALNLRFTIARHTWFKNAQRIAFYWPYDGEINPIPLLKLALALNKECYLPRIISAKKMRFHRYQIGEKLLPGQFKIYAPHKTKNTLPLQAMDLVIIPLVAFDQKGGRLGLGGGFYDRALQNTIKKPRRLGVAHHCQKASNIPLDPWDIKLHGVATDQYLLTC